jgi:uncharacterized protein
MRARNRDPWIEKFLEKVLPVPKREVDPEAVLIFGSRMEGRASEHSDINVVVLSDKFRGVPFLKRMPMLHGLARFEKHVDYLCYTVEEFANLKDKSVILRDAAERGVRVA